MKVNNSLEKLYDNIENGEASSPFLFIGKNRELLNSQVKQLALDLLKKYDISNLNLFELSSDGEKIKIDQIKKFLSIGNMDTPYKFQVFLIEDVSRLTIQAANSCLKFFEEPGIKNIIFLTNSGERGILDTILSRVQSIDMGGSSIESGDSFYYSMIDSYLAGSTELVNYFFRNKLEKDDYIRFLQTLISYARDKFVFLDYLDEIEDDLNSVAGNNVIGRGVVDKWILKIK